MAYPKLRHLDAAGHHDRSVTAAIGRRRLPDDLPERAAEAPETGETDRETDIGDTALGLSQQEHRAFDPAALKVAVRRLTEHAREAAAEMGRRNVGDRGDGRDVERLGVRAVDRVPGPQQAPVQFLDLSAHLAMLVGVLRVTPCPP